MSGMPRASHVVYAKDLALMACFYEQTLELPRIEDGDSALILGDGVVEVVLVKIPDRIAASITMASPPEIREATPLKSSFQVDDLARVARAAVATGGGIRPIDSAWLWRGQRHLDGHDPEGNVVQFRQSAAA